MKYIVYIKNKNIIDAGVICDTFKQALQIYDEYVENLQFYAEERDFAIVDRNIIIDTSNDEVAYEIEIKQINDL